LVRAEDEQAGYSSFSTGPAGVDQDLLLHVIADGFREWQESVGEGKFIHLPSGERLKLDVQLVPLNAE
jgi:hypothetical protein